MNIKVLGGGCKSCEALLASAKEAVAKKGIDAEIEYITDMEKFLKRRTLKNSYRRCQGYGGEYYAF